LELDTKLKDKVILLTGASGGIGAVCARELAAEGAKLVLHANKNLEPAQELAASLDVDSLVVQADVSEKADVKRMFFDALDHFGEIDCVVSNAGEWRPEPTPIHEMGLKRWKRSLDVNLTGHFLCAREYFRYLADSKRETASLIFIGSSAAVFGEADHCEYAAAKAGLIYGLTRTLKNEIVRLAPRGRVNAISPGWTITPMAEKGLDDKNKVKRILQTRALGQLGRPEDVARLVVVLASDRLSKHITGQVWNVNGGMEGRILHDWDAIDPSKA
jgi:3-oxoacyl-[acyl-carrier protein] reductase